MSEAEGHMRVGLVGHRSLIGGALYDEFTSRGWHTHVFVKSALAEEDFSSLACLYLVLGRDRPSEEEAREELDQVDDYVCNRRRAARTLYLSSRRKDLPHKPVAEWLIASVGGISVRPPAVFGPRQRYHSGMLIPSLVRSGGDLLLDNPDVPTEFVSATSLARYLSLVGVYYADQTLRTPLTEFPDTFTMTPAQLRDLYRAFVSLQVTTD